MERVYGYTCIMLIPSCATKQMWHRKIFSHISGCKIDFIKASLLTLNMVRKQPGQVSDCSVSQVCSVNSGLQIKLFYIPALHFISSPVMEKTIWVTLGKSKLFLSFSFCFVCVFSVCKIFQSWEEILKIPFLSSFFLALFSGSRV